MLENLPCFILKNQNSQTIDFKIPLHQLAKMRRVRTLSVVKWRLMIKFICGKANKPTGAADYSHKISGKQSYFFPAFLVCLFFIKLHKATQSFVMFVYWCLVICIIKGRPIHDAYAWKFSGSRIWLEDAAKHVPRLEEKNKCKSLQSAKRVHERFGEFCQCFKISMLSHASRSAKESLLRQE